MRRLQHLAGVLRVEVRVVVAHAVRDFEQDLAQGCRIRRRGVPQRERIEALLHARQRVMEQEQRVESSWPAMRPRSYNGIKGTFTLNEGDAPLHTR